MTSKLTRERLEELAAGQSGFNLRIATHEESQELARMALAAMDSEPVVKCTHAICRDGCCNSICPDCLENIHEVREPYSTAYLSSPVVPDEMDRIGAFDMFDSLPDGDVVDCVQYTWNACRAAMLNGGKP